MENADHQQFESTWQEFYKRCTGEDRDATNLLKAAQATSFASQFLQPIDINITTSKPFDINEVKRSFEVAQKARSLNVVFEQFEERVRTNFHLVEKDINEAMTAFASSHDVSVIRNLIYRIYEWRNAWMPATELGNGPHNTFNHAFQTCLYAVLPPSFPPALEDLLRSTVGPVNEETAKLFQCLEGVSMVERYESRIANVVYSLLDSEVLRTCKGVWDVTCLANMRQWVSDHVISWLMLPYARGAKSPEEAKLMLQGPGSRFDFHICRALCELRISEIFDTIVDFPDSTRALEDLKECLIRVDQRMEFVQALRRANKKRLLHPGADTKDIIEHYVLTIRCLRIIDPPGVLLFKVADPIRRYLRERSDTIRCIVENLVGENNFADENEEPTRLAPQFEDYSDPAWEPEPVDAGPDFRWSKATDVISTLVSIYDSKDLFVKEVQNLLALRLLAVSDGNYDEERTNVEKLKLRFGDAALQVCEVMLRDMTDSKRINQHVHARIDTTLQPSIISRNFWPALPAGSLVLPGQLKKLQDDFANEYHVMKPDKKLKWMPHLGSLSLTIELRDRTIEADVPPLAAAAIELFSEQETWGRDEIINRLQSPTQAVLNALDMWVELGVLLRNWISYTLLETLPRGGAVENAPKYHNMNASDSMHLALEPEEEKRNQVEIHWKFIQGMLKNMRSLPIDRIQGMLKMTLQGNYKGTTEQLKAFLEAAKREGLLEVIDGNWRLASR